MAEKKRKYLRDEMKDGIYVRAWKEGRGNNAEIMVQVWWKPKAEGEPDGDWVMPGILGVEASVAQAILNTRGDKEREAEAIMKKFEIATPFKTDEIEGFKVDVRLFPDKS